MNLRALIDTSIATIPVIIAFICIILSGYAEINSNITLFQIVFFIILTPILEEYLFRGLLQKWVATKIKGKFIFTFTYSNIIISIFFSMMHIYNSGLLHSFLIFFPSLIFGLLYDRSKSIIPSIITHAIYNLNIFIVYNEKISTLISSL